VDPAFPYVEVSGTSFEMGYQHGRQAAPLIRKYLAWIERLTGKPRATLTANAMRFVPLIEKLSKPYMEEVMGLAEGAGISLGEAMLCQCRGEAARQWEGGCTAFALRGAATAGGAPLAGQNQDLEPEFADVAIVLKVVPNDGRPRAVMLTFAGQLGYMGMNQHGVAEFANALYNFEWRPGLPHYPLKRMMLEQKSVAGCFELFRRNKTASAANIVLCDGTGAIGDIEVRPGATAIFRDANADHRLHCNHYLTREFVRYEDNTLPDSPRRQLRIRDLVEQHWGKIDVARLKDMLADHEGHPAAICRHGDRGMHSICGYVAEPAKGLFHVRRGHGCDGHWQAYPV
jgi:hypothetical protein